MPTAQKLGMAVIGVMLATTLLLPGRQTVPVLNATGQLLTGVQSTAMGTSSGAVK